MHKNNTCINTTVGAVREPPLHEGMKESEIHNRHSMRLKHYDYSSPGAYFVTICAEDRRNTFGAVRDGGIIFNDYGKIVHETWKWLGEQYQHVQIDEFVIMPNHMHGIIIIDYDRRGGSRTAPTAKQKPLGGLIGAFKTVSSKQINKLRNTQGTSIWQRNYYEHVIRNEYDLDNTREYITNNPANWETDEYFTQTP